MLLALCRTFLLIGGHLSNMPYLEAEKSLPFLECYAIFRSLKRCFAHEITMHMNRVKAKNFVILSKCIHNVP
jgi:hypothetical protein